MLWLLGWFNKNYVHQNHIEPEFGKICIKLFEQRTKADYDDFVVYTYEQLDKWKIDTKTVIDGIINLIMQ